MFRPTFNCFVRICVGKFLHLVIKLHFNSDPEWPDPDPEKLFRIWHT